MASLHLYVVFQDKYNRKHRIPITIFDTSLGCRWAGLVIQNQKVFSDKKLHYTFSNYTLTDLERIHDLLNSVLKKINKVYDRQLPIFLNTTVLDKTILNDLHEEFEIYGTRLDVLSLLPDFSKDLHNNFLLLNELIHSVEDLIKNNDDGHRPIPTMSTLFDYYPQTEFYKIEEIDRLHLKTDFRWGSVYLGYNTLGKDWLKIALDNDIDVIKRDMVKTQSRFSCETWINFGSDDWSNHNSRQFEKWYRCLPKELQEKVPIDNLNKLSLGRFEIGHVSLNDYFLKYHNNINDWMTPNHPIKKKWNEEVFSTFRKIIKIGFYN
jgi:hypothetical protein